VLELIAMFSDICVRIAFKEHNLRKTHW